MIHGKSSDPVFIKKIKLKIWTLRDEIEAVILKATELKGSALTDQEKTSLIDEYCPKNVVPPTLKVIDGGGESEEKQADSAEEGEAGEEDSKEKAEALLEAMDGGDSEENKEGDEESLSDVRVIQRSSKNIPADKIIEGIVVLSELGMDHLYFFSNQDFTEGQSIVVEFQVPKRFIVNINVAYSRPFNMKSRIISDRKLPFRVVGSFSFLKEGERTLLRQFIASIEPEVKEVVVVKKKAQDSGDEDDGEFGDLDDLI